MTRPLGAARLNHPCDSVVWVLDPDGRVVEIWTPSDDFPAVERERLTWNPAGAGEPFTVDLDQLFRPL